MLNFVTIASSFGSITHFLSHTFIPFWQNKKNNTIVTTDHFCKDSHFHVRWLPQSILLFWQYDFGSQSWVKPEAWVHRNTVSKMNMVSPWFEKICSSWLLIFWFVVSEAKLAQQSSFHPLGINSVLSCYHSSPHSVKQSPHSDNMSHLSFRSSKLSPSSGMYWFLSPASHVHVFMRQSLSEADRLSNSQCSQCMTRLSGSVCQISCHDLSAGESDQRMGGGVVAGGKEEEKIELLLSSGKVLLSESSFWFLSFERCSLFQNNLSTHCNQDHGKHHAWLVPPLNI